MKKLKTFLQLVVLSIAAFLVLLRLLVPAKKMTIPTIKHLKFPQTKIALEDKSEAVVKEIFDGDTILLSGGEVVRYQGIDTPEIAHFPKKEECFGNEAKKRNAELVLGQKVTLEKDKSNYDLYGRLLRYVYLDGEMINEKLIREGMAFVVIYPPDEKFSDKLKVAERFARDAKKGVWVKCDLSKRKKF